MSPSDLPGDFDCLCPRCGDRDIKLVVDPPQWMQNRIGTSRYPAGTCEASACLYVGRWSEFVMAGWEAAA